MSELQEKVYKWDPKKGTQHKYQLYKQTITWVDEFYILETTSKQTLVFISNIYNDQVATIMLGLDAHNSRKIIKYEQ